MDTQSSVLVQPNHQHTLQMWTELVSETSENLHILTRMSAKGSLIEFRRRDSFITSETTPSAEDCLPQLVKKLPAFYGTRRFITVYTIPLQLSPSSARLIQFPSFHSNITFIITPTYICSQFFSYRSLSPPNPYTNISFLPIVLYVPPTSSTVITSGSTNHKAPPCTVFSSMLFRRPPQYLYSNVLSSRSSPT